MGRWPQLESLKLGYFDAFRVDVAPTLSTRQAEHLQTVPHTVMWHCINTLDWYGMNTDVSTVTQLATQEWPFLHCVRLMSCRAAAEEFETSCIR